MPQTRRWILGTTLTPAANTNLVPVENCMYHFMPCVCFEFCVFCLMMQLSNPAALTLRIYEWNWWVDTLDFVFESTFFLFLDAWCKSSYESDSLLPAYVTCVWCVSWAWPCHCRHSVSFLHVILISFTRVKYIWFFLQLVSCKCSFRNLKRKSVEIEDVGSAFCCFCNSGNHFK